MDAKSARTLSLLTLKADTKKALAPVFKEIEDAASEGLFFVNFFYNESVETYWLIRTHKNLLEEMGYTVLAGGGREGDVYQVEW